MAQKDKKISYQIIPSIISQKPKDYQKIVKTLEKYVSIIQFDVMDDKFVKGKTFDHKLVAKIKTKAKKEVHLMTVNPLKDLDKYIKAGASTILVHIEAEHDKNKLIKASKELKAKKVKFGLVLNPSTNISRIKPMLRYCDKVNVMTRIPGKSSMPFDPNTLLKIKQLREMKDMKGKDIEADGAIDKMTISYVKKAGANHFVVGSALFENDDIKGNITELKRIMRESK